jgi:hypothetical protein
MTGELLCLNAQPWPPVTVVHPEAAPGPGMTGAASVRISQVASASAPTPNTNASAKAGFRVTLTSYGNTASVVEWMNTVDAVSVVDRLVSSPGLAKFTDAVERLDRAAQRVCRVGRRLRIRAYRIRL